MQINFENVSANYVAGPIRTPAVLKSINLTLEQGSFTAVIGHTGAGKTSLLKAMNGLLIPTEGKVKIGSNIISSENNKHALKIIRKQVGMIFQFPESQLFAKTVEEDICYGPLNFGIPLKETKEIAKDMVEQVGLHQSVLTKSPFSLSGGQKRRVAIAGVLATQPEILVLDEPGAGLDPEGKEEILSLISTLNDKNGMTIVLVTHDMNDVAHYAKDAIVMEKGQIVKHAKVRDIFSDQENLTNWRLDMPDALRFQLKIEQETGVKFPRTCLTVDELASALIGVGII